MTGFFDSVRSGAIRLQYAMRKSVPFAFRTSHKRLFFPGCSLTCSDPALVADVYRHIHRRRPDIGLWSDCCGMPLKKYVSRNAESKALARLASIIEQNRIREVITACGNCAAEFTKLESRFPQLKVTSLYDLLSADAWPEFAHPRQSFSVHHPCPARSNARFRESFVRLARKASIPVEPESRDAHALSCCLLKNPAAQRKRKNNAARKFITYCGHCVREFQSDVAITHVLHVLFRSGRSAMRTLGPCGLLNHLRLRKMVYASNPQQSRATQSRCAQHSCNTNHGRGIARSGAKEACGMWNDN